MKFKDLRKQEEPKLIREGTWQVPKTMKELQKLSEMLYVPYPAKTRRKVIQFQKAIPMGDDHMYDVLDDVGMTDERRLQKWDEPVYINVLAGKALEKEGWITGRVTNNGRSYDAKTHGFGELSELEEMTMLPRKKGNLKPSRKMLKLERVKDGKLDPLSKMGKSKLTGQEIATYYRKNPKAKQAARDPMVKKAIELALDLGGNQTLAVKEIEKMKRGLSKNSAVASALRTANEEMTGTSSVAMPDGIPLGKVKKRKELDESVGTITIDFSKAPNPKRAKEKTIDIAKKYKIKVGKPKKPQSKDDVAFTGSKQAMKLFGKEFNLAGKTGLLESLEESLKPHEEKISKMFKTKNPVEIKGIDRLIDMSSIGVVQDMQKQNPRGFKKTVMHLGKINESIDESTSLIENKDYIQSVKGGYAILYRVKNIQTPELNKFKSSAKLMKLKMDVKQSPNKKETLIRLQGNRKQLRDLDAVVRGKSSYGDPSLAMQQREDAVERAKELADLKAKHKREVEQEKDEIERTKQSASAESVLAQLDALEEQIDLLEKQLNEESQTMKKVRQVIKKKSMMNIDGMKLDLTTASMIASVYDKVNPTNKKRMDSLKLPQLVNLTMKVAGKGRKESTDLQEGQTYKSLIQGLEKDKKEVASKSKAFRQNDTKYIDKAINFLKMLEKEGIPAGQIGQVDFVTNRVPKFFIGPANKSPSLSKFTPNDVKKAVAHAKKLGIIKESTELQEMHPKSMDAMKRLNMRGSDAFKDQMPTIGWDAGKQMYRVVMLSKKTGKPVRTSHIPVSKEFPAPKDKNKINAKELGKAMKTLEKKIGMKIGVDESTDLPFSLSILEKMSGIPKLTSIEQGRMVKIKKRFPKLPEPVVYKIMKLTHKGNKIDARKYVEIGNLYDKDYKGGTGDKFIQKLRNMGEAVSPAQQAAIAISKKERGEKPKDKTDENRAKRDAMRDMGTPKDKEDDGYGTATDDDRKAADKNVIMQIRRVADLPKGGQIELPSGKKVKMDRKSAIALNKKFDSIRKPQDKLKLQKMMNDKKISVVALKRLLGK